MKFYRPTKKNLLRGTVIALALWAAYFVVANLVLRGDWLKGQLASWKDGRLTFHSASSPFPGYLVVKGFNIRHEDDNVRWGAQIDTVTAWINPLGILIKSVDFRRIRGVHAKFQLRPKAAEAKACLPNIEPIPGPRQVVETAEDKKPSGVTFAFNSIELTDFSEIWVDCYRFHGEGEVDGGFVLASGQWALIKDSDVKFKSGAIDRPNEGPFIRAVHGNVNAEISRFPSDVENKAFFSHITAQIKLHMQGASVDILKLYTHSLKWLTTENSPADMEIDVGIKQGYLTEGSRATARGTQIGLGLSRFKIAGDLEADFSVHDKPKLMLSAAPFSIIGQEEAIRGKRLMVSLVSQTREVYEVSRELAFDINMPEAQILSLRDLNAFLPTPANLKILEGRGVLDFHLASGAEGESGRLALDLDKLRVQHDKKQYEGDLALDMPLEHSSFQDVRFRTPRTSIRMHLKESGSGAKVSTGTVDVQGGLFDFGDRRYGGHLGVVFSQSAPLLEFIAKAASVPGFVGKMMGGDNLVALAEVEADRDRILVQNFQLKTGSVEVKGDVCAAPAPHRKAAILVWAGPFAVAASVRGEESSVVLHEAAKWFKTHGSQKLSCLPGEDSEFHGE